MNFYFYLYDVLTEYGFGSTMFGHLLIELFCVWVMFFVLILPLVVVIWFLQMVCGRR